MAVMKAQTFVEKAIDIAKNYKTLYVMGCIGAPLTSANYGRYTTNYAYNGTPARKAMIKAACNTNPRTFGFDCVCLIKSILWGWNGNPNAAYGGAEYCSNGVPDISEAGMINACTGVSADFGHIDVGEAVYQPGHIGIYIGNGEVVECSPAWKNGVQITKLPQRKWTKHGKLPWVDYAGVKPAPTPPAPKPSNFLGPKGYLTVGDKGENVRKICQFMFDAFPAYAQVLHRSKYNLLGPIFGENLKAWILEFQRRTKDEARKLYGINEKDYVDGNIGPITLAMLKRYGFKE